VNSFGRAAFKESKNEEVTPVGTWAVRTAAVITPTIVSLLPSSAPEIFQCYIYAMTIGAGVALTARMIRQVKAAL